MKAFLNTVLTIFIITSMPAASQAQESDDHFRDQFDRHFNYASMRIQAIAEEMPEELYSWRPGEEVMSFAEVCMHIARYNYYYPVETLGFPAPEGIDMDHMESVTDKETIVAELERSIEYVRTVMEEMPDAQFNEPARLYGLDVSVQAVFLQLITHKSEHLGQAISYARVNNIVPPWSR